MLQRLVANLNYYKINMSFYLFSELVFCDLHREKGQCERKRKLEPRWLDSRRDFWLKVETSRGDRENPKPCTGPPAHRCP